MTWVKICGITNVDDAVCAVEAGADALGFVFTDSKRRVVPADAARIVQEVRSVANVGTFPGGSSAPGAATAPASWLRPSLRLCGVDAVGVFTGEPVSRILDVAEAVDLDVVQLHSVRPSSDVRRIRAKGYRVIQGVRVRDAQSLKPWARRRRSVDAVLLDAWSSAGLGGTGERFDWSLLGGEELHGAGEPNDRGRRGGRVSWSGQGGRSGNGVIDRLRPAVLAGGLTPFNVREALERLSPDGVDVSTGVEEAPGTKSRELVREFVTEVRKYDGDAGTSETLERA